MRVSRSFLDRVQSLEVVRADQINGITPEATLLLKNLDFQIDINRDNPAGSDRIPWSILTTYTPIVVYRAPDTSEMYVLAGIPHFAHILRTRCNHEIVVQPITGIKNRFYRGCVWQGILDPFFEELMGRPDVYWERALHDVPPPSEIRDFIEIRRGVECS